ncbi:MAG: hypothetical protein BWY06_03027 [Candidatus Latescibacteria bacterium ADurb.Bin168]|nr:MAG: hypothetical protein BWY06_03027 [Candidatus Latescibacteria bacterium ADurb.Bin168]
MPQRVGTGLKGNHLRCLSQAVTLRRRNAAAFVTYRVPAVAANRPPVGPRAGRLDMAPHCKDFDYQEHTYLSASHSVM